MTVEVNPVKTKRVWLEDKGVWCSVPDVEEELPKKAEPKAAKKVSKKKTA